MWKWTRFVAILRFFGIFMSFVVADFLQAAEQKQDSIQALLASLRLIPEGRYLLERAVQHWKVQDISELNQFIQWGSVSYTDTLLTRSFHPLTGVVKKVQETRIYIAQEQETVEKILDLSHELVHAIDREKMDPYEPTLTVFQYIYDAIEGKGGEVEAVFLECKVARHLESVMKIKVKRCHHYQSKKQIQKDFYKIGLWYHSFVQKLGQDHFPELSSKKPVLYSSTSKMPYPAALYTEFMEMNQVACENSMKRKKQSTWMQDTAEAKTLDDFLERRCSSL